MIKTILKGMAGALGYEVRRQRGPQPGTNWTADLQQLFSGRPAPVLFDVGANRGVVTARLAAAFPAPARIHAFEPAGATCATLAARFAADSRVRAEALALGAGPGTAMLYHGLNSELNRMSPCGALGDGTTETVTVDTLDSVAARLGLDRIDCVKTDTEGHDLAVLQGAAGLLARKAIDAIVSEVTFESPPEWHTSFAAVQDFLTPHGFCLYGIYETMNWDLHLKYANVLFVRPAGFPGPGPTR